MQLEQGFTLAAPLETVWLAFHDIGLLVDCLPGASIDPAGSAADAQSVALLFKVKLGPIATAFAGQGRIALDDAARSGSFAGSAVDRRTSSRIKGEARFALQPDAQNAQATRIALTVDYTLTGALAQFSREGIVRALAEQLTLQFAEQLQARLPQAAPAAEAGAAAPPAGTPQVPHPDNSSIDLWRLFRAWLRSLLPGASRP